MYMTINTALKYQRAQMVYYRQLIGRSGVKSIQDHTILYDCINPNTPLHIGEINKIIPRGGDFEFIVNLKRPRKIKLDKLTASWYQAYMMNKIYTN